MPQKACEGFILLKCHEIEHIHFRSFFRFKIDHVLFFSKLILKLAKWGISRFSNIKKWGISRKNHVINFKTEKGPKMDMFDFVTFQENTSLTCFLAQKFLGISRSLPYNFLYLAYAMYSRHICWSDQKDKN